MRPVMVAHPIKPELEGTDLSAIEDPNGELLFVAFVDTVKAKGAGFVSYVWDKPGVTQAGPQAVLRVRLRALGLDRRHGHLRRRRRRGGPRPDAHASPGRPR